MMRLIPKEMKDAVRESVDSLVADVADKKDHASVIDGLLRSKAVVDVYVTTSSGKSYVVIHGAINLSGGQYSVAVSGSTGANAGTKFYASDVKRIRKGSSGAFTITLA